MSSHADSSITTLNCDECGAIVGMFGLMAIGCAKHPRANYSKGGTYVAVDALTTVPVLDEASRVFDAFEEDMSRPLIQRDRDGMEAAILAAVNAASSRERG